MQTSTVGSLVAHVKAHVQALRVSLAPQMDDQSSFELQRVHFGLLGSSSYSMIISHCSITNALPLLTLFRDQPKAAIG